MARRISASVVWLTGTSGRRVSLRTRPSRLSAYFVPFTPGFGEDRRVQRRQPILDFERVVPVAF